ncbi:MAG: DNA-processing protein DprA [Planctomycetota bacterium]
MKARLRSDQLSEKVRSVERLCADLGMAWLRAESDSFPGVLGEVEDRPVVLFLRGDRGAIHNRPAVAIVGSRTPTAYGLAATEDFASTLASVGVTIWSGLARGIDQRAHQATLAAGGRTVAVLAGGLDEVEPRSHQGLADAIVEHGGALISEAPPGHRPRRGHFPRRNRILARAVDAVLVIEAGSRSGTLHTARHAVDAGVDVFAVPGPYTSERCRGCHALLREGAQLADSPSRLLRDLGWSLRSETAADVERCRPDSEATIDPPVGIDGSLLNLEFAADLRALLSTLQPGPRPEDAVLRESGLEPETFIRTLVEALERSLVTRLPGGLLAARHGTRAPP